MIDRSCPSHYSPTAISCVANCTCPQSKFRLSFDPARWRTSLKGGRQISPVQRVCCFYPCTRSGNRANWPWWATRSSIRCRFSWSLADTSRRFSSSELIAVFVSHDVVADEIVVAVVLVPCRWKGKLKVGTRRLLTQLEKRETQKKHSRQMIFNPCGSFMMSALCWFVCAREKACSVFKLLRYVFASHSICSFVLAAAASFTFSESISKF